MSLDPARHWLAAGITGLPRQREWDAVVTVAAPGETEDEAEFVALGDGRLVVETAPRTFEPGPLAEALQGAIEPPYRAVAVRRPELWVVGARSIEVGRLDPDPGGDELELIWDGVSLALAVDRMPADPARARALEAIAAGREEGPYSASARRLHGELWELLVLPL